MNQDIIVTAVQAQFDREVDFLQRLVCAKSNNPFLPGTSPADTPVEREVAELIQRELQALGFTVHLIGVSPQRPNVVCHLPGTGEVQKTLILTTHMDTVGPDSHYSRDPWGAQVDDGRLYGVGVADAKAQIAAFIYAAHALQRAGIPLAGALTLAFVVDEETGACSPYGTQYLLEHGHLHGDAAIVGEPGDDLLAIGHRGLYRFRIQITGKAAHTGLRAWEEGRDGRNAILDMARLAQTLSAHPLPATPSLAFPRRRSVLTFPTLIQGGSGINVVPSSCEAYGDTRLLPGLSAQTVKELIEEQCQALGIIEYRIDDLITVPAAEIDQEAEIVQALAFSIESVTSARPPLEGVGPACDGWMFITRGIPAICGYGVRCGGVHGADEWADLASLRNVTEIYARTIVRFLGERSYS
jgi:acetylornithine deacetylase/succinyl-diaminopimelate desuccinylase-like protein